MIQKDLTSAICSFTIASMNTEEMLKLRLEGKSHAVIAKLSTERGRPVSRQRVQQLLKAYPVSRIYVTEGAEKAQDSRSKGVKGLLDKVALKVKKFV